MEKENNKKFQSFMKKENFFPSKKMGQNFLIDQNTKEKIVNTIEINEDDNVVEIGPGFGALTKIILTKTKNLEVIELDKRLVEFLTNEFPGLKIYNSDVLKFDFKNLKKEKYKIVSNLPYSVSSKIILKLLKEANFDKALFMVQKEMADRLIAKCGSKKYNNFTVLLSITSKIKKEFDVPPSCFYPKPEIYSTIISFSKNEAFDFDNFQKLEKFLLKTFSQKRKTIFNNLKNYFDISLINKVLSEFNIDPKTRPENIEVNIYKEMYLKFYDN